MTKKALQRSIPVLMLITLFSSVVLFEGGFSFADTKRPAEGSIKFGAEKNPASQNAKSIESFKTVFADIADKVVPTVVSVIPTKVDTVVFQQNPFYNFFEGDPFSGSDPFEFFFGRPRQMPRRQQPPVKKQERRQQGLGSGVIVSKEGYILTNYHVVSGADEIEIKLQDGRTVEAEIVGSDSLTDVAVLKIKGKIDKLSVAYLGDSDKLRPGDWVVAVGNPFSLTSTVTTGIVSALGRNVSGNESYQNFIQTDAAINPGNSGGALVNIDGELIGINTMIYSRSGGNMGIGFAIPINMAKRVMEDLIYKGEVVRGWIGATIQDVDHNIRSALDLGDLRGVLVSDVIKDQPAEKAGIKRGDILMTINGKEVNSTNELRNVVAGIAPDKKVPVEVFRDGKKMKLNLTIGRRDQSTIDQISESGSSSEEKGEESVQKKLGFKAANLTKELRNTYNISEQLKGVVVTGNNNARLGLAEGDVISQVKTRNNNFVTVENLKQFETATKDLKEGDSVVLLIHRAGNAFFTAFRIGK